MFVIELPYKATLEGIERQIPAHNSFLDQQYANGIFLAPGRRVPGKGRHHPGHRNRAVVEA